MSQKSSGDLTHFQQAKHAFALHQDQMLWSRTNLLIAAQSVALIGAYTARDDALLAWGAVFVGGVLTVIVALLMWRDDKFGEKAFEQSRIEETPTPSGPKGKHYAAAAIALLLLTDLGLVVRVVHFPPTPAEPKPVKVVVDQPIQIKQQQQ